jgi:hypothetical protein
MILTYSMGELTGRLQLSVILYYLANGNQSLARIIEVLLYYPVSVVNN